jgi:hypothetical protein
MFYVIIYSFISYGVSRYVMSPPIREAGHGKALQDALSSGILQVTHLILYSTVESHAVTFSFSSSICIKWYISHQETILASSAMNKESLTSECLCLYAACRY